MFRLHYDAFVLILHFKPLTFFLLFWRYIIYIISKAINTTLQNIDLSRNTVQFFHYILNLGRAGVFSAPALFSPCINV